jgi:hypothetical protein
LCFLNIRYYEAEAEEAYEKAKKSMVEGKQGLKTWEENMLMFEDSLAIFKEDSFIAMEMRQHIMHCTHDVSFEDFVFLTAGPLENGVFYNTKVVSSRNKARNVGRNEMKKALGLIVAFPEFKNWHCQGKAAEVRESFAEDILGKDYAKLGGKPSGYIRTVYRVRMAYEKYETLGKQKGISRLGSTENELLGGVVNMSG